MANLPIKKSFPLDKSYDKVVKDLHTWYKNIVKKLNEKADKILLDISTTFDDVHYFASFTNALLIEQENQLRKATTHEEMNIIEERINQIISEVQLLQSLSFRLNSDSVKLTGKLQINYNNKELKSNSLLIKTSPYLDNTLRTITNNQQMILSNNNYRFLISRNDAIQLKKSSSSILHLTSLDNESITECVLTFHVSDLDSFLNAFASYWKLFSNKNNEIRILIPENNISFIMGKSDETLNYLANRFQLDEIKIFPDFCPKSNEKILLINGKQRDLIQDCIEEIYYNIEENNKNENGKPNIKLYNPGNLSTKDINEITNVDYGGFIHNQNRSINVNQSRSYLAEDEDSSNDDDDLWDENDEWWNFQDIRNNNSEIIQREMSVSNMQAGVIIGLNALRIDRIKQKTGAYVYINGETKDSKRTVFIKGTHQQADRAYACIENLLERHKNGKLPMKQQRSYDKRKGK